MLWQSKLSHLAGEQLTVTCRPACYKAYGSSKEDTPACDYPGYEHIEMELVRHVSFVDCPGVVTLSIPDVNNFCTQQESRVPCIDTVWIVTFINGRTGHDILMATMLNGAAVMDGALLLIAANETCPQPQTSEHLAAVEIMRLEHIIILQNKIDLIRCGPC